MRLGLDIGTTSIGWWLYETEGKGAFAQISGVIDGGVRIFGQSDKGAGRDPKSGASWRWSDVWLGRHAGDGTATCGDARP